ncbi:MAG: PhoH family protein [Lachnospiraceae bacterium]
MGITETLIDIPFEHQKNVFGQFDAYIKKLERTLRVTIVTRDGEVKIIGADSMVQKAKSVLNNLVELSRRGNTITEQNVDYALSLSFQEKQDAILEIDKDIICRTINGKPVKPKTLGQKSYVNTIRQKMIVFGVGPAGTGKTYLAMAMAIQAFKNNEVNRIILTRPAIEAGEKLGFLPGDLQSKIDPYLRPLYDALYQIMGPESFLHNQEKGLIEVAPLAYMRGRTLDNAYIILDEAQNTTPAQMKMFLTRIGFGSKVIITGDMTQKDLPAGQASGLDVALRVLKNVDEIGVIYFDSSDVVRHPLVQKIVQAYDDYEQRQAARDNAKERRKNSYGVRGERGPQYKSHQFQKKDTRRES